MLNTPGVDVVAASPPTGLTNGAAAATDDQIPDFSRPARRVRFRIDTDVFEGPRELPADHALAFIAKAERWQAVDPEDARAMLPELFAEVLLPESLERFRARLVDQANPISLGQLPRVVAWLFEVYGDRPTVPSSDSSTGSGSPDDGTSSTAAPPPEASTPPTSPLPASST